MDKDKLLLELRYFLRELAVYADMELTRRAAWKCGPRQLAEVERVLKDCDRYCERIAELMEVPHD